MEALALWPFSEPAIAGSRPAFIDAVFGPGALPPPAGPTPPASIDELLLAGGYPPAVARDDVERRHPWFGSYVTAILERDVRDMANIEALTALPRLLSLLAARAASLLNFAELARSSALLIDTGLAGYLLGLGPDRLHAQPGLRGPILENFVAMELIKQVAWSRHRPRLFHFRDVAGREVDFVLEDAGGQIVGIEVKASSTVTNRDFDGLRVLSEHARARFHRGIVIHTGEAQAAFGANLHAVPLAALWSA